MCNQIQHTNNTTGQGQRYGVIECVQKDPLRKVFKRKFKESKEFRRKVGFKLKEGDDENAAIELYLNHYDLAAKAPGKNIKLKDMDAGVTKCMWAKGVYKQRGENESKVITESGAVKTFKADDLNPYDPSHDAEDVAEDVTMINGFGEASLLLCMKRRLIEKFNIYTYVSDIVLVLNPYMGLPDMTYIQEYPDPKHYMLGYEPTVYASAHMAYHGAMNLRADPRNQSCVVSGESGAGKTVACGYIMEYLAKLSNWRKLEQGLKVGGDKDVTTLVAGVSPFLEAFGNAKTNMNDNSSRFGKFTKIWLDDGKIIGAELEHYLLEKARIVGQGRNERNYHIFYFLLRGATSEELKSYFDNGKTKCLDYPKLWEGALNKRGDKDEKLGDVTIIGHDHGAEYDLEHMNNPMCDKPDDTGVRAALLAANVNEKTQQDIWRIAAGVLRITSLEFEDGESAEKGQVKTKDECARIAKLMGFKQDGDMGFEALLCCQIRIVNKEELRLDQTKKQCKNNANALAKEIYGHLFTWLIDTVCNKVLCPSGSKDAFVGLLDIFGFENFVPTGGKNSIEQLCINFANEKLQYLFNKHVFDDEKKMYASDGIDPSMMPDGKDNKPCIDLVERKAKKKGMACGILRMLSEFKNTSAGKKPPPTNNKTMVKTWVKAFGMKRGEMHKTKERWMRKSSERFYGNRKHDDVFHIWHYAGDIEYDAHHWLEKNEDKLPKQLMNVVMGSSFEFLKILFEGEDEDTKKKKKKKNHADDLCGKYLHQLGELSKTLASTEPHYVRCVKPNDFHFTPIDGRAAFDVYKTYRQLLYAGVMEVVKIKKMGYPFRETFESFWEHRCLKNQYYRFVDGVDKNSNCKEGTQAICEAILRKPEQVIDKHTEKESTKYYWVLGNTKIWGKDTTPDELTEWHRKQVAGLVQSWWRFTSVNVTMCAFSRACETLRQKWREELLTRKMKKMMPDIVKSQCMIMSFNSKTKLCDLRKRRVATIKIQAFRRAQILLAFLRKYSFVVSVQKWYRGNKIDVFTRARISTERVRAWYRARHLLNALRDRNYVIVLQHFARKFVFAREWARLRLDLVNRKSLTMLCQGTKQMKTKLAVYKFVRLTKDISRNWKAARKIQKIFRGHRARVHFRDTMRRVAIACRTIRVEISAEVITQMYFANDAKANSRRRRDRNLRKIVVQYQTWRTNMWFRTMCLAARCLQRYGRGCIARSRAHRRRYVLTKAQAVARAVMWVSRYVKKHRAIRKIQSAVRMLLMRRWHRRYKKAALIIEDTYYRKVLVSKLLMKWHHDMRGAASNGDVGDLVRLLECLDKQYENRLEVFPNLVNLKCPLTGETYLHLAVRSGNFDAVRTLLLHGCWVDEADRSGQTPFHLSCSEGGSNKQITALLLQSWTRSGPSALYSFHEPRLEDFLYSHHAFVHTLNLRRELRKNFKRPHSMLKMLDNDGNTPLDLSIQSGDRETTRFLRTLGAISNTSSEVDQNRLLSDNREDLNEDEKYEISVQGRVDYAELLRRRKRDIDPQRKLMVIRRRMAYGNTGEDPITVEMRVLRKQRVVRSVQKIWRGWKLRKRLRDVVKKSRVIINQKQRMGVISVSVPQDVKRDLVFKDELAKQQESTRATTDFMNRLKKMNARRKAEEEVSKRDVRETKTKRGVKNATSELIDGMDAMDEVDMDEGDFVMEPDLDAARRYEASDRENYYRSESMKRCSILPPGLTIVSRERGQHQRVHDILIRLRLTLEKLSGKKWFYVDKRGVMRGPYTSEKMRAWFARGLLNRDLRCNRGEHAVVFHSVRDLYGNTEPFLACEDPDHSLTGLVPLMRALSMELMHS